MTDDVMRAKTGEQLVYLVWEANRGRAQLAVICTSEDVLDRYVTLDRRQWLGRPGAVFVEKVMTDHLYGGSDMAIAMRIMRRS